MDMWASARRFTHDDLRKAFDEYAEPHGDDLARLALQRSTGARDLSNVPEGSIINGMVELVGGYSFVGQGAPARAQAVVRDLANIHASLAAIGEKAFAGLRSPSGNWSAYSIGPARVTSLHHCHGCAAGATAFHVGPRAIH
jgi:hypothetical protein